MNPNNTLKNPLFAGMAVLSAVLASPLADAGAPQTSQYSAPADEPMWKWGISADYMYRSVDRSEDYISGDYVWHVDYDDLDGDLWGFTAFVTPPCFLNTTIDFSYRTGDLDGRFMNYSLDPRDFDYGNVYEGEVSFDREEYVVGLTYPIPSLNWLYARAEWFQFDEDGDWKYNDGFGTVESQEYTLWGITAGLGASYGIPLGNTGATLDLNAFAGLVYFDFEHSESDGGSATSWDDWGFQGRLGARVSYPLQDHLAVFLGGGYEYLDTSDGSLDMENQGLFVNLGLKGEF
jgi:hypothetical protein